jgi:hypothetical protein
MPDPGHPGRPLAFARIFFMESKPWLKIGRALLRPFV